MRVSPTAQGRIGWNSPFARALRGAAVGDNIGWVERVDLSNGKVDRLYTHVDGNDLRGPNDLVFDHTGNFWFSDLGKSFARSRDKSALYYCAPDGSMIRQVVGDALSFNGVGLSPDQTTLYVADTLSARIWGYELTQPGVFRNPDADSHTNPARLVATVPGDVWIDSLAVTASGSVCVGTINNGGITTVTPEGSTSHLPLPDPFTTNICFGGPDRDDAFITLSTTGRIARCKWPERGLALNFNPY